MSVKLIISIVAAIVLLGGVWSAAWVADERYVKPEVVEEVADELELVSARLEQKIRSDRVHRLKD